MDYLIHQAHVEQLPLLLEVGEGVKDESLWQLRVAHVLLQPLQLLRVVLLSDSLVDLREGERGWGGGVYVLQGGGGAMMGTVVRRAVHGAHPESRHNQPLTTTKRIGNNIARHTLASKIRERF